MVSEMKNFRPFLVALAFSTLAYPSLAQIVAPGHVIGNGSASARTPTDYGLGLVLDQALGSANGSLAYRNGGVWSQLTLGSGAATALSVAPLSSGSFTPQNGAIANGNCLKWSTASGVTDAGAACGSGSGGSISFPQTVSGTTSSGGIPYFSSSTVLTSSAALASGAVVTGGGAGSAPATDANATLSTGTLSLGASGTLGAVKLGNATSGTMTLEPATGALGGGIAYLPSNATSDTLAALAATQTLSNKTWAGGTISAQTTINYDGDWFLTGNADASKMHIGGYAAATGTLATLLGGDFAHIYFNHNVPTPSNGVFTTTDDSTSASYTVAWTDNGLMDVFEAPATGVPGNPPVFVTTPTFSLNLLTGALSLNGNAVVYNSGPLGTPSSGTLTHATGLPLSGGISGFGTNVVTALGNTLNGASGLPAVNGSMTVGHCLQWSALGVQDAGGACTTGGGGGTVTAGTTNQLAYYAGNGTTVSGLTTLLAAQEPAHTGDMTNTAGSLATTVGAIGGKTVSLGAALTTTGAGAPTLAFPASSYTYTFPAATDTVALLAASQTLTGKTISGSSNTLSNIALPSLSALAANSVMGNATGSPAAVTALSMTSCSTAASAVSWTTSGGFGCNTSITAAAVPVSGITSLGTNVGTALGNAVNMPSGLPTINGSLTSGDCLQWSASGIQDAGSACGSGGGTVSSVSNADGSITISPTTGAVVASMNTGNANVWSAAQTFPQNGVILKGTSTGNTTLTAANASSTNYTVSVPAVTTTLGGLGATQTWTAPQTFSSSAAFTGSTSSFAGIFTNAEDVATVATSAIASPLNIYFSTQSVYMNTTSAQTANWTVNFALSSGTSLNTGLAVGRTVTAVVIVYNGATAYYNNTVQIDGSTVTPYWQGGTAPTAGDINSYDVYTYSITKTAATPTYVVLASVTKY